MARPFRTSILAHTDNAPLDTAIERRCEARKQDGAFAGYMAPELDHTACLAQDDKVMLLHYSEASPKLNPSRQGQPVPRQSA